MDSPLLLLGGGRKGIRYVPSLTTITPAVGRRTGSTDGTDAVYIPAGDVVAFGRGNQISGNFYQRWDGSQLTFAFRIVFDKPSTYYTGTVYALYGDANWSLAYNGATGNWVWTAGSQSMTVVASAWAQGDARVIAVSVDTKRVIDATNYGRVSINDVATFGMTSQPTASVPATFYLGSNNGTSSLSGIYEGATVCRRVLYDGTYGVQPSDGDYAADELAAIYNAGAFRDPAKVVPTEDIVYQLAPKARSGALTTTDEGWSFPHSSNLLTSGHMLTTYASSGWGAQGTPSAGPADIADAANKVYGGGYQFTSDAANEGITQTLTVAAGADVWVSAWAHGDANSQPALVLYDVDGSAEIGRVVSGVAGAYADVDAPWRAELTCEAPAGCTHIAVRVINLAASGVVYVHQAMALPNLLSNPSFETAGAAPPVAADWVDTVGSGTIADEATLMRSGAHAIKLTRGAADDTLVGQDETGTASRRYRLGLFMRGDGTNAPRYSLYDAGSASLLVPLTTLAITAAWQRAARVFMAPATVAAMTARLYPGNANGAIGYGDDVSLLLMDTVALTVTPAAASSLINGADRAARVTSGQLGRASGRVAFGYTPTWSAANAAKGQSVSYIFYALQDASNFLHVWRLANLLYLAYKAAGGAYQSANSDITGAWDAGVAKRVEIVYNPAGVYILLDGVKRCAITAACVFAAAFGTVYFGSETSGANNADGTFA